MKTRKIHNSLALIGGLLGLGSFINYKTNCKAVSQNMLDYVAEDFFEWKNCSIFFKKFGTRGKPILLLHDLCAYGSAEEWEKIIPELSKNHRVYVMDLLGCGRSDKPSITYTNFVYVQIVLDFIKYEICEKTLLIASSNSAQIAIMAAAYDSSKFSGFILINPPSIETTSRTPNLISKYFKKILEFPVIGLLLYNSRYTKGKLEKLFKETIFYSSANVTNKMLNKCFEAAHLENGSGRYLEASLDGRYLNIDIRHALKKIDLPLSIYYSDSYKNKELIVRIWKKYNSCIRLVRLSRTGLYPHLEIPDRTVALIETTVFKNKA